MKIIITEQQINEIVKFNKEHLNSDKITELIESIILGDSVFPICDIAVTKSNENDLYMVLILTPKNSRFNDDVRIEKLIKQYIPINVFVLVNETECDEFIN